MVKYTGIPGLQNKMRTLAQAKDKVGRDAFMEGRVTLLIKSKPYFWMYTKLHRSTVYTWMKGFITIFIDATHSQQRARNLQKHHTLRGTTIATTKHELPKEIELQLMLDVDWVP